MTSRFVTETSKVAQEQQKTQYLRLNTGVRLRNRTTRNGPCIQNRGYQKRQKAKKRLFLPQSI